MTPTTKPWGSRPVAYFQGHYRYICAHHKIPLPHYHDLEVDNDQGPDTNEAVRALKRAFGVTPVTDHISTEFLEMVRDPWGAHNKLFTPARNRRGAAYRAKVRAEHSKALKAAASGSLGEHALAYSGKYVGKVETGNNTAPWLDPLDHLPVLPTNDLNWMIPGNPYCGLGDIVCFWKGANVWLPESFVDTTTILGAAGRTYRPAHGIAYKIVRIPVASARPGSILVFDWSPGTGADHTGIARGTYGGGQIATREWNTSPGTSGSQSNGGGVWNRTRPGGLILGAVNIERVS